MIDQYTEFEPTTAELTEVIHRRKARRFQQKSRGDVKSAADLFENAAILIAWEAGEVSEEQASKAMDVDRVTAREARLQMIAFGRVLASELMWDRRLK